MGSLKQKNISFCSQWVNQYKGFVPAVVLFLKRDDCINIITMRTSEQKTVFKHKYYSWFGQWMQLKRRNKQAMSWNKTSFFFFFSPKGIDWPTRRYYLQARCHKVFYLWGSHRLSISYFLMSSLIEEKYQKTNTGRKLTHHLIGNGNLI